MLSIDSPFFTLVPLFEAGESTENTAAGRSWINGQQLAIGESAIALLERATPD